VRPNNWLGYQTCGILTNELEYKMDDDDCGKIYHGYICGDIRTSSQLVASDTHNLFCACISNTAFSSDFLNY